jgi:hypothetical protein
MPAKNSKKAVANAAGDVKPVDPNAAQAQPAGDASVPAPAPVEQKEKKPRPPPKIVTGSSVSETRVRKALGTSMGPDVSRAVSELKLLKDKDGKTDVPKKFGELSDATVLLILQHKPRVLAEEEVKKQTDEQKKQVELRNSLHTLLQGPRASWCDRPLTKEEAKVLRRMVKQDTIRTGDDAINTFTGTANFVVRDLALAGLRNLKAEEKRVMKLHHVVEDIASLESWPLLKELRCVAAARADHTKRLQDAAQKLLDKKEKQKKKKAEKASAAAATATTTTTTTTTAAATTTSTVTSTSPAAAAPAPVAEAEPAVAAVVAAPAAEEKAASPKRAKTPEADFEHHSQNIVREVCQSQNVVCEISGDVKHFCSLVVYEMVCMYGELIQNQTNYAGVKTIKADTVSSVTRFILAYTRSQAPGLLKYVEDHLVKLAEEEKKAKEEKARKAAEAAAVAATAAAAAQPAASQPAVVAVADPAQPAAAVVAP